MRGGWFYATGFVYSTYKHDPRLCVWTLLNCDPTGFAAMLAVVCTSFSSINVGTSKRSPVTPLGDVGLAYVRVGNMLMARSLLLVYLVVSLGGCFVIEQPGGSLAHWFPRFEQLVRSVIPFWEVRWWARHYGALTPMLDFANLFFSVT